MSISEMFQDFIKNLEIDNKEEISSRYGMITKILNKKYRDTDSTTANTLQVGSYGRFTAIKNISDLDMIYMLPQSEWDRFKNNRQSALLQEVKETIKGTYSTTEIRADGQVVVVSFKNQKIEVVPAFEESDGSFKFPDTNNGGSWPITKPRAEIKAISDMNNAKNFNLRRLCKMVRSWKNKHGIPMGGLLIDTLCFNFLNSTTEYNEKSYSYYDWMVRDFFEYLSKLPDQDYYLAPGSNQQVKVKKKFQRKAKKAYELCLEAINSESQKNVNDKWKAVFGRPFPSKQDSVIEKSLSFDNTEEFIEDSYPIDIQYTLEVDCQVSQNGYREDTLRNMIFKNKLLLQHKTLLFSIIDCDVPEPYEIKWKILNRGEIAEQKNQIRGQIVSGEESKTEFTSFQGEHQVECFILKNGIVVARDQIDVPISVGVLK